VAWAVLGWVRRNLFNEAPTVKYDPTTTVQTGQTVTGNIGATDPEGDKLTYIVTKQPTDGTVTIDQATGKFTYTPKDIDYDGTQTDSFTVSVSDGKTNLLSLFGQPHSAQTTVNVTVQPPTVDRVILNMPDGVTKPVNPRYAADGNSI
jgi:VCBS repeat-containing protein